MIAESFAVRATAWILPIGHALIDFLWQGAVIAACAWLLLRSMRDARPQARYAVACLALLACLCLPLSAVWRLRPASLDAGSAIAPGLSTSGLEHASSDRIVRWWSVVVHDDATLIEAALPWIVALWSIGAAVMLLRLLAGMFWVQRLRARCADGMVGEDLSRHFETLCERIGLRRRIGLRAIADGGIAGLGPIAAGIMTPVVIVPAALLARMPSDLLEALLAHELAHIRRHDYLINLLQTLIEALLFYHPAVWWLSRRIRHERELVADALAARTLDTPRTLAHALAELDRLQAEYDQYAQDPSKHDSTARPAPRLPLTLSQAAQGGSLMSRIESLIQSIQPGRTARPVSGVGLALPLVGLTAIALACLAYAQSDHPHIAQPLNASQSPLQAGTKATARAALPAPQTTLANESAGVSGLSLHTRRDTASNDRAHLSFALVRSGKEGFTMSGDDEDIARIRAAKARIRDDFVWFRRDGKAYVVRDPATIARIGEFWRASDANSAKMQALSAQMETKSKEVQAMAQKASERAMAQSHAAGRAAQVAQQAMLDGQLAERQADLAKRQAQLQARQARNPAANEGDYERESVALEAQQAALEQRMQKIEAEMEAESARIEAEVEAKTSGLDEEIQAQIEAATAPLEALGAQMETLGNEQEKIMADVERQVEREIERALRENLAEPAPDGHERQ